MRDKDKVEVFCKKCGRPFLIPRDVWELAMLVRKNRLKMDLESPEFRTWLRHLTVIPTKSMRE